MLATEQLLLLDPTAEDEPEEAPLNPRPSSLEGLKIGLLDNTHRNVDIYMEEAERILRDQYGVAEVIYLRKANANSAAPPAVLQEMVARADAVVHAVAD